MDSGGFDNPAHDPRGDCYEVSSTDQITNGNTHNSSTSRPPHDEEEDLRCGLGDCQPSCCQVFNNPRWMLVWLSWFSFIQGFVVNGVNNVNTTSIERRFGLASSQVGLISSAYDISAGVFVIPISYFGAFGHQPRMLSLAALVMSLGSFVMAIPHFTTGAYQLSNSMADTCDIHDNMTQCDSEDDTLHRYLGVLMLGQFLHGIGGTTLYTLGIVFIDTSVHSKNSPMYQGILYTFSTLGPAVGYLLGGYFLNYYVDFNVISSDQIGIEPEDPAWVGAWWIGFLASGCLFVSCFFILIPYARMLPHAIKVKATRKSETHCDGSEEVASKEGFGKGIKDLPMSFWLLLKNPVNMLVTFAGVFEGMTTSGMATFLPKLLENQFGQTAATAAMMSGGLAVPGSAGGMFLGGLIAKLANFKIRGNLIFNVCVSLVSIAFTFSLLAKCPSENLAGVFTNYPDSSDKFSKINLTSGCNQNCHCTQQSYEPVCSPEGLEYFSPCHAGCSTAEESADGTLTYENCTCMELEATSWDGVLVGEDGHCTTGCWQLYLFLVTFFIVVLTTFMQSVPGITISLRCVPESQRSFAIGVKWVFMRFLGTVLGPVIYGSLFDTTCLVWQQNTNCGDKKGSCWIYDRGLLSWYLIAITLAIKVMGVLSYSLALCVYKPPPQDGSDESGSIATQDTGLEMYTKEPSIISSHKDKNGQHREPPPHTQGSYTNPAVDTSDE